MKTYDGNKRLFGLKLLFNIFISNRMIIEVFCNKFMLNFSSYAYTIKQINVAVLLFFIPLTLVSYAHSDVKNSAAVVPQSTSSQVDDKSVFGQRQSEEKKISTNRFAIAFYKPNYVLPFYFTVSPYQKVYFDRTPNHQKIQSQEFKAQFSFQVPLFFNILGENSRLSAAYTQRMYWQVYAKSQYFRETNYQPELFIMKRVTPNFWMSLGVEHESNGRGGKMERSWNRAYINAIFSRDNFAVSLRPWILIFKKYSSNIHNPDINRYLGHGELIFAYKWYLFDLSLKMRNNFESGFHRGANELSCSMPVLGKVKLYLQFFSGYGQSLIEYNHYTNSFGVGIALSDWI